MLVRKSLYGNMRPNPGDLYDPRDGSCLPNFHESAVHNSFNQIEQDLVKYDIQLVRDPPSSKNTNDVSNRNLMLLAVTEYAESLPAERTTANPFVIDKVFFREAVAGVLELHTDASDRDLSILQANLRKCLPDPSCLGGLMLDQFSSIIQKISILQHGQEYFYTNLRMAFVEISKIINQVCSPHNLNARSVLVNLPHGASYAILDRNRYLSYLHEKEQLMRQSERRKPQRQSLRGGQSEYTLEEETNALKYGDNDHREFHQDQHADLLEYSRNQTPLQTHYHESNQMPGHYNENKQMPGHYHENKQMPGHYHESNQMPGHYNENKQMPGHYNENKQMPGHYNENKQMPGHYNENKQMTGHYNENKQMPGHYNENKQMPGHYNENKQMPGHYNEGKQMPAQYNEDLKFQTHYGNDKHHRTPYNEDEKLFRANDQMSSENGSLQSSLDYNSLPHYKRDNKLSTHENRSSQMSSLYKEDNQTLTNSDSTQLSSNKQFMKYPMETSIKTINGKKVVIYHDTGETVGYDDYLTHQSYNQDSTGNRMNSKSFSKSISNLADDGARTDTVSDYRQANLRERAEPLSRDRSKSVGDLRNDEDKIDRYPSLLIVPGRKQVRKIHTLEENYDKWKKKSPKYWGAENEERTKTLITETRNNTVSTNDRRGAKEVGKPVTKQDAAPSLGSTKPIINATREKIGTTDTSKPAGMNSNSTFGQPVTGGRQPVLNKHSTNFGQPVTGGRQPVLNKHSTNFGQPVTGGRQPVLNSHSNFGQPVTGGRQPVLNSHSNFGQPVTDHPNSGRQPVINSNSSFRQPVTGPPMTSRQPAMGPPIKGPRSGGPTAMGPPISGPRNCGPTAMTPRRNVDQVDARYTIADKIVSNQDRRPQHTFTAQPRIRRNSGDSTLSNFSEISLGSHYNKDVERNFNSLYKSSLQRGAGVSHYAVRGTVPESDSSFAYEATPGGSPEPMGDTLDREFTYRAYPTQIKRSY